MTPTADSKLARELDGLSYFDAERGVTFRYHFTSEGLTATLPEKFGEKPFLLTYVFGAGEHGASFLSLLPSGPGEPQGIEHRVSVFGPERRLDLTPDHAGLEVTQPVEELGRIQKGEALRKCLGCHTTTGKVVDGALIDLRANVGCEKCHGPGARHIEAAEHKQDDLAIRFGKGKNSANEQIRMCGTCHRHPEQLAPDEIRPDNQRLAKFQPVGLLQSACYTRSAGKLVCTTCHDPHEHAPLERERYDASCINCHAAHRGDSLACPVSPRENCVTCHMPATEVRPGTAFHDHWIRRRVDISGIEPDRKTP